ncbi:MAG: ATP-binding protein [Chloroflexia bacterium]
MTRKPFWFALRRLRAQLLLWAVLPLALTLIAVAFTGVYGHEHSMYRMVGERDRLLAEAYAHLVAARLASSEVPPTAETWQALFQDVQVGKRGVIYLVDGQGHIIYHPNASFCGVSLAGHTGFSVLSADSGSTPCHTAEGLRMLLSYAAVPGTDWRVVVEEPWEDLTDPILRLPKLVPFVAALTGLVVALALVFGARTVVSPLQRLARAAGRVSWGDLSSIAEPVGGVEEIRELQAALREMADRIQSYQESVRDYLGAVTEAQENERARLAREIHDDTVQALIALGQRIEMVRRSLERGDVAQAKRQVGDVRSLTLETAEGLRRFTRDLRPAYLEELGFLPALETLVRDKRQEGGPEVSLRVEGTPRRLLPTRELGLYRIAQEALHNALRHAQARHIWVTLRFEPEAVRLIVSDDGNGFQVPEHPAALTHEGHYGLLGMRERALLAGGELHIVSQPGKGTTVTARVPG